MTVDLDELAPVINDAKTLAKRYRNLTGRPLGITGEVAEYEAARLLELRLAAVRQDGYDAIRQTAGTAQRLQIKGRCILDGGRRSQQVPSINRKRNGTAYYWCCWTANLSRRRYTRQTVFP